MAAIGTGGSCWWFGKHLAKGILNWLSNLPKQRPQCHAELRPASPYLAWCHRLHAIGWLLVGLIYCNRLQPCRRVSTRKMSKLNQLVVSKRPGFHPISSVIQSRTKLNMPLTGDAHLGGPKEGSWPKVSTWLRASRNSGAWDADIPGGVAPPAKNPVPSLRPSSSSFLSEPALTESWSSLQPAPHKKSCWCLLSGAKVSTKGVAPSVWTSRSSQSIPTLNIQTTLPNEPVKATAISLDTSRRLRRLVPSPRAP